MEDPGSSCQLMSLLKTAVALATKCVRRPQDLSQADSPCLPLRELSALAYASGPLHLLIPRRLGMFQARKTSPTPSALLI